MSFWRFQTGLSSLGDPLQGDHHIGLSIVAMLVAILAASVLWPVMGRYRASTSAQAQVWWIVAGALAMGCGVWTMHFTGMLAHRLPVPVAYDPLITLLSMVPVTLGTALTIYVLHLPLARRKRLRLAALALGLGVGGMHYVGMEAIRAPVEMRYQPLLFLMSLLVVVALSWLGLFIKISLIRRAQRLWLAHLGGSVVLGLAVTGMHYAGKAATTYYPGADSGALSELMIDHDQLAILIALAVTLIITLLLSATRVDRRLSDISEALSDSETRFRLLAETSDSGIFTFDQQLIYSNPAVSKITGYSARELAGMAVSQLLDISPGELDAVDLHKSLRKEVQITTRSGERRWLHVTIGRIEQGQQGCFLANAFDITERKLLEQELRELAFYDRTTGLPNRAFFMEQLEQRFERRGREAYAVLFLNVDRFKVVNDHFGLVTGDQLLAQITRRLQQRLRQTDLLARVGGDEFAVLLDGFPDQSAATALAQDLQDSFSKPFFISRQELFISVSMGVAFAHASYRTGEEIYRDANIAMVMAKRHGKGGCRVFDAGMQRRAHNRVQMEVEMRRALELKNFELHYQPIVALEARNRWQGFEALLRWRRSDGSYVPPAEFIPLAEESGLINPLGGWVLEQACLQIHQWNEAIPGFAERGYISVNMSTPQFFQTDLLTNIMFLIEKYAVRPGQLRLELTEGILMEDSAQLIGKLQTLRSLGCLIMIDDFGTGYSSLSYLHRFPVSVIKIDQSFIRELNTSDTSRHLVQAIISMAHALDLRVVAEGVEDLAAMQLLARMRCESAQGYLFSRPMPAAEAEAYLRSQLSLS